MLVVVVERGRVAAEDKRAAERAEWMKCFSMRCEDVFFAGGFELFEMMHVIALRMGGRGGGEWSWRMRRRSGDGGGGCGQRTK